MKLAILGYGSIAEDHVRAIDALRATPEGADLAITAVMGPKPEPTAAFARDHGIATATTDLDALLADDAIDAVIVCSPSEMHAGQTDQALRAKKHVLCEIPLALSLAESEQLTQLAADVDRRLMICHSNRFSPAAIEARRRIASGELHPHAIVSRYLFNRRENVNWKGRQRSWTDNLLWHHGCHAVDASLWLLGVSDDGSEVETVAQIALPGEELDIPMDLSLIMRTARDQLATVIMSYHSRVSLNEYLIIGDEATLLLANRRLWEGDQLLVDAPPDAGTEATIAQQDAAFFAAVRSGGEPPVSGQSVRPAMAALQAAQATLDARRERLGMEARHPRLP